MTTTTARTAAYHRLADQAIAHGHYAVGSIGLQPIVAIVDPGGCPYTRIIRHQGRVVAFCPITYSLPLTAILGGKR